MKKLTIIVNPSELEDSPHQAILMHVVVEDNATLEQIDLAVFDRLVYNIVGEISSGGEGEK